MLGTLHHFDPADAVAYADMPELERLLLHELAGRAAIVRQAYAEFDYKTVVATLSAFMNTELSAFYFDIRKDTLYCDPPSSVVRKAALTTIDIICDAILRWLAPVLSFTTDEAWRMYKPNAEPSVHLTLLPEDLEKFRDDALAARWETIRNIRRVVTGALELERAAKNIGSSLEASPLVYVSDKDIFNTLFDIDLAEVCITSNAMVTNDEAPANAFRLADVPDVAVVVEKAVGTKCARSWKILPTVGEDAEYPDVSPRDAEALREWKALAQDDKPVDAVEESIEPVGLIETQQPVHAPLEATPEPAASESETAAKPARKVRARKILAATQVEEAERAGSTRNVAAASKTSEANAPAEAKAKKAKAGKSKTKKAVTKKAVTKKPVAKKAVATKAKAKKAKTKKAAAKKSKANEPNPGRLLPRRRGPRRGPQRPLRRRPRKRRLAIRREGSRQEPRQRRQKRRRDKCPASNARQPLTSAPASLPRS